MDTEHFDPNNLETHMATQATISRPLYSINDDGNIQNEISFQQSGRLSTEDANFDEESGLISDPQSDVTKPSLTLSCESGSGLYSNILSSGKLFTLITKATGLWNPRKKHFALLCAISVVLNILSLLAEILITSICGPFGDRCVTGSKPVTNVTNERISVEIFTESYLATFAFSDTVTYLLLIYTLCRIQQKLPSLCLASAQEKVTSREWLLINIMLVICSLAITVATVLEVSVVERSKIKMFAMYGVGILIVYVTAFTCCCVFVVLTCALASLADACFQEICNMGEGNLDDVTAIHQTLCRQLSSSSQALIPWFLPHWLLFGANCLVLFAFDSTHFSMLFQQLGRAPAIFVAVAFVLNFLVFLIPCVCASRVTWKCQDLLYKVTNMSSGDWSEGHPFRERANVNEFIFYAERSKCGFRIGKMNFGSSGTWISVFLGLLGLGVRALEYIK